MPRSTIAKLMHHGLLRLARDERGVSAIEFAMILPLMVTLYLGGVEVTQGITIDRKVTLTARTVADLMSQERTINDTAANNILAASSAVMAPFPTEKAEVTVTLIKIDANKNAKAEWSYSLNGTPKSGSVTVPAALLIPETSLVWGEVTYTYEPAIGYVVTGEIALKDQIYMRPRFDHITKQPS